MDSDIVGTRLRYEAAPRRATRFRYLIMRTLAAPLIFGSPHLALAQQPNGVGPNVGHMALIIANADYDGDGSIDVGSGISRPAGVLPDLANPCRDAQLFRQQLLASRWKTEEIVSPPCNQTAEQMRKLITDFRKRVVNATNTVVVFYYSGHGAQFTNGDTSHSYLFGAGARFDLADVERSLKTSPENSSFVADQAVDLHELVSTLGRQTDNGVLIVLDACRDNPVYAEISAFQNANVAPLSSNTDDFTGIVMAYSTPAGRYARDGFGQHSIYSGAIAGLLKPDRYWDSVLNAVRRDVVAAYRKAYPDGHGIQEPITRGRFSDDWCVWACAKPAAYSPLAAIEGKGGRLIPPAAAAVARPLSPIPQIGSSSLLAVASAIIMQPPTLNVPQAVEPFYDLEIRNPGLDGRAAGATMRFDVFWCDGGKASEERLARARSIATSLGEEARRREAAALAGGPIVATQDVQLIGSVRVRRLSTSANTAIGFRYVDDVAVYDDGDLNELAWSRYAASRFDKRVKVSPDAARTPGYISIVICRAPQASTAPTTFAYLQVPSKDQQGIGQRLLDEIASGVPQVEAVKGVEVRSNGPRRTELRFTSEFDRDRAFATAAEAQKRLQTPVTIQYMPRLANSSTNGHVELWVGKDEPSLALRK